MRGRPRPPKLRSGRSKGGHANKPEFLSRKEQGVGALGSRFSVCQLTRFVYEEEEAEPDTLEEVHQVSVGVSIYAKVQKRGRHVEEVLNCGKEGRESSILDGPIRAAI